jgi:hypothetical protein
MGIRIKERVWHPASASNADWSSVLPETVVLLDGAAPVVNEPVSNCDNDAVWLVRSFPDRLADQLAEARARDVTTAVDRAGIESAALDWAEVDIAELAEAARSDLEREYAELCRRAGLMPAETPFACLCIVHDAGERLEILNLGDLTTIVRGRDDRLQKLGENAVRELDRQAVELLARELAAGVEPHSARHARIRPTLLANRALRNRLAGYDVLDVRSSCRGRFERLSCPRGEIRDLLLMSDGFYRLVDTFGRYTDTSLFEAAERRGLDALLEELRTLEEDDPECTAHLRFKRHDDATALWLELD